MANLADNYAAPVLAARGLIGAKTLVETGSHSGNSVVWALPHFQRVISIDIRAENQVVARERAPEAVFLVGDSRRVLRSVVLGLGAPAIFFLDAHEETGLFGVGKDDCPVLDELDAINASPLRHAILIDDAHCFQEPYDPAVWPRLADISAVARAGGYELRKVGEGLLLLDPEAWQWGLAVLRPGVLPLADGMPVHERVSV